MMTPLQCRMARAALKLTVRKAGAIIGVSGACINRYENHGNSISQEKINQLSQYFQDKEIFFGPKDGICIKSDVFTQERKFANACYKILNEYGIYPSSADLLKKYD